MSRASWIIGGGITVLLLALVGGWLTAPAVIRGRHAHPGDWSEGDDR